MHLDLLVSNRNFCAHKKISTIKEQYEKTYYAYRDLSKEIIQLSNDEKQSIQKIDMYQFQIKEIEDAKFLAKNGPSGTYSHF